MMELVCKDNCVTNFTIKQPQTQLKGYEGMIGPNEELIMYPNLDYEDEMDTDSINDGTTNMKQQANSNYNALI